MPQQTIRAHVALFLVALIYAANYTIAKVVMDTGLLSPSAFIIIRLLGAVTIIWLVTFCTRSERVARKDHLRLIACGLTGSALNQLFFFEGLHRTSPIHASLIMTITPIIVLILGVIIYKYPIKWHKWIGIALGITGASFLILKGANTSETLRYPQQVLGNSFIAINATAYAIYLILVKSLMAKYKAWTVIRWVFLYGLLFVLPIGLGDLLKSSFHALNVSHIMSIAYVILFTTVAAYVLNAYAIRTVRPSVVSMYIYLQPVLATAIAVLFRNESLRIADVLMGLVICVGVLLVSIEEPKRLFSKKNQEF